MNVELTHEGRKKLFNWDNVITAGMTKYENTTGSWVELWCVGNVTWRIDESYEEMKKAVKEAEIKNG